VAAAHERARIVLFEEHGEFFEHDAAQLLGVDDGHRAAVIAGHVMADADRGQLSVLYSDAGSASLLQETKRRYLPRSRSETPSRAARAICPGRS
jgi:hypothetical protein